MNNQEILMKYIAQFPGTISYLIAVRVLDDTIAAKLSKAITDGVPTNDEELQLTLPKGTVS